LPDGSLLVATSQIGPNGLADANGQIFRFKDANGDGVADGPPQVLFSGLVGVVTSMEERNGLLFVGSGVTPNPSISILRLGATPDDPFTLAGKIQFESADFWSHSGMSFTTRATPGDPGKVDLVFNLGSKADGVNSTTPVNASGLFSGTLAVDAIYKVTLDAGTLAAGSPVLVITGIRNAFGMAFYPGTGDFYFVDNGIDGSAEDPVSADELNFVAAAVFGTSVVNFGFADCYVAYRTGVNVGSGCTQPLVAFQPLNGAESEGPASMTLAPSGFPAGLNEGFFIGFYGKGGFGPGNEENAVVFYNPATGKYFHFIAPGQAGFGGVTGMLGSGNSLFLSNFFGPPDGSGKIYQITYLGEIPEPSAMTISGVGLLALILTRRYARRRGKG
jgi:hypothetical protein